MSSGASNLPSPLAHPEIAAIWIAAVTEMGLSLHRTDAAYATYAPCAHSDSRGRIQIGVEEILDPDDALAQLIFHELCHGLVEGPEGRCLPDWGLSNGDDQDVVREHACLRVQVHLAEPHGLRELMAPTTEYRLYHDRISGAPLDDSRDPAGRVAQTAIQRPTAAPWIAVLERALGETRRLLDATAAATPTGALAAVGPESASPRGSLHPVGFAFGPGGETCAGCAWLYRGGRGRPVPRCRQSAGADGIGRRTDPCFLACVRFEPPVSCQSCGACCREAYHSVTVSVRDPVVWKRPELVVRHGHRFEILREGDRCAALEERSSSLSCCTTPSDAVPPPYGPRDGERPEPGSPTSEVGAGHPPRPAARHFSCAIYQDRPRPCREFEAAGPHCLVARRRVGLTP